MSVEQWWIYGWQGKTEENVCFIAISGTMNLT
jgi:hypothetical protein